MKTNKSLLLLLTLPFFVMSCKKNVSHEITMAKIHMLNEAQLIEMDCGHIHDFWRTTINARYGAYVDRKGWWISKSSSRGGDGVFVCDFNEALSYYLRGGQHKYLTEQIDAYQDSCKFYIAKLKDAKSSQQKACEQVRIAYRALQSYEQCSSDPTGSLMTYTRDCNEKQSRFIDEYREIDNILEFE